MIQKLSLIVAMVFSGIGMMHQVVAAERITGQMMQIEEKNARFTLISDDGDVFVKCVHAKSTVNSMDWKVTCEDGDYRRIFRLHLVLSKYEASGPEQTKFELLYWVTDQNTPRSHDAGTTLWFKMKNKSELNAITIKQGLEGHTLGLWMDLQGF